MTGHYPDLAPPHVRFRFCPKCATELDQGVADVVNQVARPTCPGCGWVYYPPNHSGALVVVEFGTDLVVLHPPGCLPEEPCGLPGGIVEFGESLEECAVREVREETGLLVELTAEICRLFDRSTPEGGALPLGPMLQVGFVARVVGGDLREGDEGPAVLYPTGRLPVMSPFRAGSVRVFDAYKSRR